VILSENQESQAVIYNLKTGKNIILRHESAVTDVAFSSTGLEVATSDKDGKVILWNAQTGERNAELDHAAAVLSLDFSGNGTELVAGLDGRGATTVWDLASKSKVAELDQVGDVSSVLFSPDGKLVATGDNLGVIDIWDATKLSDPKPIQVIQINGKVLNILFSPDQRWLVVGSSDNYAHLLDLATGKEISRLPHAGEVTGLAFTQDGKQLFTVSGKVVQIWEIAKLVLLPTEKLFEAACSRLVTNMNLTNWQTLFEDLPYQFICPNLPQGKG